MKNGKQTTTNKNTKPHRKMKNGKTKKKTTTNGQ